MLVVCFLANGESHATRFPTRAAFRAAATAHTTACLPPAPFHRAYPARFTLPRPHLPHTFPTHHTPRCPTLHIFTATYLHTPHTHAHTLLHIAPTTYHTLHTPNPTTRPHTHTPFTHHTPHHTTYTPHTFAYTHSSAYPRYHTARLLRASAAPALLPHPACRAARVACGAYCPFPHRRAHLPRHRRETNRAGTWRWDRDGGQIRWAVCDGASWTIALLPPPTAKHWTAPLARVTRT